jgi:thioredoxin-dependent peroxiredoxin
MRIRGSFVLALVALLAGLSCWSTARGGDAPTGPEVGKPAPAFRLNDHTGKAVEVGGAATTGWTILAFYPKAMTAGCTKEVCSLRDAHKDLEGLDANVYAISIDDVAACAEFVQKHSLNFRLLSDPDRSVVTKYGAVIEGMSFAARYTFVIDPKGVLRHVDKAVNVVSHGADLVAVLKKLKAG